MTKNIKIKKAHLTNKQSRKTFKKLIKARKKRVGRLLHHQQIEVEKSTERKAQKERTKKFYEKRRELIKDAPKPESQLLTEEEALGVHGKEK